MDYDTVEKYIASFSPEIRKALNEIRSTVRKTAPEAEETIAYRMPAYKLNGKPLVYFAAFKNHIGFYPTPRGIEAFDKELKKYKHAKGSVQFPLDKPMPLALIKKMVKFRVKENTEKAASKKSHTK